MLIVLAIGGAFAPSIVACESTPRAKGLEVVEMGRAAWAARKSTCTAYFYDRTKFLDPATITSVQIVDDVPKWREYAAPDRRDAGGPPAEAWLEQGSDVGSHAQGFAASTVEQLYDDCEAALSGAETQDFQLTLDEGALTRCGWPDGGCVGAACDRQVNLLGFSCGEIAPPQVAVGDGGASSAD
jgi:hypothetical protein